MHDFDGDFNSFIQVFLLVCVIVDVNFITVGHRVHFNGLKL